jgi:predicted nucleic acid-binding protein
MLTHHTPSGTAVLSDNIFVDTNILLYSRDTSEPEKQAIATVMLTELWVMRNGRLSVQVLNEYFVNVTRKLDPGLSPEEAWDDIEALSA